MLGLKLPTDPNWVKNVVESNIEELLTDHAFCEQKATSNAISIIVKYPEYSDMVTGLIRIAQEEIEHFRQVHELIIARGFVLGMERKDSYVNELMKFINKGGNRLDNITDRLLFSAMIEARSCERFKVLSQNINDDELSKFYHDLMISEADHYTTFLNFARKYGDRKKVDARWEEFLKYEAEVVQNYGKSETIHG